MLGPMLNKNFTMQKMQRCIMRSIRQKLFKRSKTNMNNSIRRVRAEQTMPSIRENKSKKQLRNFLKRNQKNWTTRRIKRRKEKKMDAEKVAGFLKQLFQRVVSEDVFGLAAQLAYFFLLSLFPFLLFLLSLIGYLPL